MQKQASPWQENPVATDVERWAATAAGVADDYELLAQRDREGVYRHNHAMAFEVLNAIKDRALRELLPLPAGFPTADPEFQKWFDALMKFTVSPNTVRATFGSFAEVGEALGPAWRYLSRLALQPTPDDLVCLKDAKRIWQVSERTIRRLVKAGELTDARGKKHAPNAKLMLYANELDDRFERWKNLV